MHTKIWILWTTPQHTLPQRMDNRTWSWQSRIPLESKPHYRLGPGILTVAHLGCYPKRKMHKSSFCLFRQRWVHDELAAVKPPDVTLLRKTEQLHCRVLINNRKKLGFVFFLLQNKVSSHVFFFFFLLFFFHVRGRHQEPSMSTETDNARGKRVGQGWMWEGNLKVKERNTDLSILSSAVCL